MKICIHDWKLYPVTLLQGSALWTRGRHRIFTRIWKNDIMCQDDILQEHSPLVRVQVDSLFCTMSIRIKEHTVKKTKIFGES